MEAKKDFWKEFWNERATADNMFVQIGRTNYTPLEFFIMLQDIIRALKFRREDVMLDAGSGAGWNSIYLSPFVKEITLFDYAEKMVDAAADMTKHFGNIRVIQDDLLVMANVRDRAYHKVMIGSVIQYLDDYEQMKTGLSNIFSVMQPKGMAVITHNPDIRKKEQHVDSYSRLNWDTERIKKGLEMEKKRFWLDIDIIEKIASEIGFSKCYETPINPKLWQSTHMFDCVVEK